MRQMKEGTDGQAFKEVVRYEKEVGEERGRDVQGWEERALVGGRTPS